MLSVFPAKVFPIGICEQGNLVIFKHTILPEISNCLLKQSYVLEILSEYLVSR